MADKVREAYAVYVEMCGERKLTPLSFEENWFGEYNRMLGARPYIKKKAENELKHNLPLSGQLLSNCTGGMPHGDFLRWIAARLVNIYGESENVDFVLACLRRADELDEATRVATNLRAEAARL